MMNNELLSKLLGLLIMIFLISWADLGYFFIMTGATIISVCSAVYLGLYIGFYSIGFSHKQKKNLQKSKKKFSAQNIFSDYKLHDPIPDEYLAEEVKNVQQLGDLVDQLMQSFVIPCLSGVLDQPLKSIESVREGLGERGVFHLVPQLSSPVRERNFLRHMSEYLLIQHLPENCSKCSPLRVLLRELITYKVLEPLIEHCSNPDWINQQIIEHVQQPRVQLSPINPLTSPSTATAKLLSQLHQTNDLAQLRTIRQKLIISLKELYDMHDRKDDSMNASMEVLEQWQQVSQVITTCNVKINGLTSKDFAVQLMHKVDCRHGVQELSELFNKEYHEPNKAPSERVKGSDKSDDNSSFSSFLKALDNTSSKFLPTQTNKKAKNSSDKTDLSLKHIPEHLPRLPSHNEKLTEKVPDKKDQNAQQTKKVNDKIALKLVHSNVWNEALGKWKVHVDKFEEPTGLRLFVHALPETPNIIPQVSNSSPTGETVAQEWVIDRSLDQFNTLMKKLCEIQPSIKPLITPEPDSLLKKRPFNSSPLARNRTECQHCFDTVMIDDKLFESEVLYEFLSPFSMVKDVKTKKLTSSFLGSLGSKSEGSDEDLSVPSVESAVENDVVAEPLFLFLEEVCDLRGAGKFLRKTLMSFAQIAYGKNITRHVQEVLHGVLTNAWEQMKVNKEGTSLSDLFSPKDPKLARSLEESRKIRSEAKEIFLNSLPDSFSTLVGYQNGRRGALRFFVMFQHHALNKNLFYIILEELLKELYPQLLAHKTD